MTQSTVIPPQTTNFRTLAWQYSPTSLQGPNGQKLVYTLALPYDTLAVAAAYAVRFRFPLEAPEDAFSWLAQDRQIDRGPNESTTSYATRLTQWLDLWKHAGSADAIITAIDSFVLPSTIDVTHVKDTRNYGTASSFNQYDVSVASAAPYTYTASPANWNWDDNGARLGPADQRFIPLTPAGLPTPYWRTWEVVYAGALWTSGHTCGDGVTCGSGATAGSSMTSDQVQGLRTQVLKWKSAEAIVQWIVLAFDATWFLPTNAAGVKMPDGTWPTWGKLSSVTYGTTTVNAWVPARSSTAAYLDGGA